MPDDRSQTPPTFCIPYEARDGHIAAIKGAPFTVLSVLLTFADKDTGEAFPSQRALMKATGYSSDNTIRNAVAVLEKQGLLTVTERGQNEARLYTLKPSFFFVGDGCVAESATREDSPEAPPEQLVPQKVRRRKCAAESAAERELTERDTTERSKAPPIVPPTPTDIYAAYPRRVGKQRALKAIEKALSLLANGHDPPIDDPATWLAHRVQVYRDSPYVQKRMGTEDECYIPHPATWFNGGNYDDEPSQWGYGVKQGTDLFAGARAYIARMEAANG